MLTLLMLWKARAVIAVDLHDAFRPAAQAVLDGRSPYPPPTTDALATRSQFVYLPFASFLFVPFALVPALVADLVGTALVIAAGAAALWTLGIRDWRCYGLALASPPVLSAIQTVNLTLPLALALAAAWVMRNRRVAPGLVLALTLATKLFLWPMLVWLLATRRYRAAGGALAATAALIVGAWAAIGFDGAREYAEVLRVLAAALATDSYTPFALATDLGARESLARALGGAIALAVLGASWVFGRRGDDRRSFTLAILAALLFTPIVWLHYFTLLFVPIAIVHRRLSALWAAPCAGWLFATGFGNGTTLDTVLVLLLFSGVAALTLAPGRRRKGTDLGTVPSGDSPRYEPLSP
jgi:alpha-1,2-mannosyltransferase